ncbi:hypothetical protein, partial [Pseudomonas aeruginosa]|uniref:hypothetical protein n=1 Tax=Pseudomonas aeruginosa TaxID=287 RepID=UPI001968F34E
SSLRWMLPSRRTHNNALIPPLMRLHDGQKPRPRPVFHLLVKKVLDVDGEIISADDELFETDVFERTQFEIWTKLVSTLSKFMVFCSAFRLL